MSRFPLYPFYVFFTMYLFKKLNCLFYSVSYSLGFAEWHPHRAAGQVPLYSVFPVNW